MVHNTVGERYKKIQIIIKIVHVFFNDYCKTIEMKLKVESYEGSTREI